MEIIKDNQERNLLDECQKELDDILSDIQFQTKFGPIDSFKYKIVDCVHWIIQYLKKNEKENRIEELGAKSIADFIESRNKKAEDTQKELYDDLAKHINSFHRPYCYNAIHICRFNTESYKRNKSSCLLFVTSLDGIERCEQCLEMFK